MAKKAKETALKEAAPLKKKDNVWKAIIWIIVVILVIYIITKLFI